MRAAVCRSHGLSEVVQVEEIPAPPLDAGQVRVRVHAAAANFRVFVPHPIQDRTDQQLRDLADGALDATVAAVVAPEPPSRQAKKAI